MASLADLRSLPWRVVACVASFALFLVLATLHPTSSPFEAHLLKWQGHQPGEWEGMHRNLIPASREADGEVHRNLNADDEDRLHILAYGDSITHGYPEGCPYADYLQANLDEKYEETFQVDHIGLVSKKTSFMLDKVDSYDGLHYELQAQKRHPAYDVVIILAGTNDLPHRESVAPDTMDAVVIEGARSIATNLKEMHRIALASGAAHTIAVEIPQSRFQEEEPLSREIASKTNKLLRQQFAGNKKTTVVPFPFEYDGQSNLWVDYVHPSCAGYEAMAEALAPTVLSILQSQIAAREPNET